MKSYANYSMIRLTLFALILSILGGCGGYAREPGNSSGVEVYGTVDVGVGTQRGTR